MTNWDVYVPNSLEKNIPLYWTLEQSVNDWSITFDFFKEDLWTPACGVSLFMTHKCNCHMTSWWHVLNHFSMNYDISFGDFFFPQNWPLRPHAMLIQFSRLTRLTVLLLLNMDIFKIIIKAKIIINVDTFYSGTHVYKIPSPALFGFKGM